MRQFFVKVPTKTYIRKYKEAVYGPQAVRVGQDTALGSVLYISLSRKMIPTSSKNYLKSIVAGYTDKFLASVADYRIFQRRLTLDIDDEAVLMVNRYLENAFAMDLYRYCQISTDIAKRRQGRDECIECFAKIHGIDVDEDISFEALKKAEYRIRKRIQNSRIEEGIFHGLSVI